VRHGCLKRRFGRIVEHRKSMFANMASSLVMHEKLSTTLPKAKYLKPLVEKLVTMAKNGKDSSRRLVLSRMRDPVAVKKLFEIIAPRCENRNGGYLRITKVGFRFGDDAPMGVIEFVDRELTDREKASMEA